MTSLGPGRRAGIWFQGCSIECAGCVSVDTWNSEAGSVTTVDNVTRWAEAAASRDDIRGITISGGEPFDQPTSLRSLLLDIRESSTLNDFDVLVYSGYTLAALTRRFSDTLELVDAVMSGPFVESRPTELPWRGSSNQRLTLMSERGRERFGSGNGNTLQVAVADGKLWIIGIPHRDDLAKLELLLCERGVELGDVSWRV